MPQPILEKNKGFVSLFSVIIVISLILFVAIGVAKRTVDQTRSINEERAAQALAMANLCAEMAITKLQSVLDYVGNETITVDGQSCNILTIEGSGNFNRVVKAQSNVSGYSRKIKVEISQISFPIQITSWTIVPDF